MNKIICPVCQENNQTSKVTELTSSVTTSYSSPFYDEEGNYHNHDSNKTTTNYQCSNGHSFKVVKRRGCTIPNCSFKSSFKIVKQ